MEGCSLRKPGGLLLDAGTRRWITIEKNSFIYLSDQTGLVKEVDWILVAQAAMGYSLVLYIHIIKSDMQ